MMRSTSILGLRLPLPSSRDSESVYFPKLCNTSTHLNWHHIWSCLHHSSRHKQDHNMSQWGYHNPWPPSSLHHTFLHVTLCFSSLSTLCDVPSTQLVQAIHTWAKTHNVFALYIPATVSILYSHRDNTGSSWISHDVNISACTCPSRVRPLHRRWKCRFSFGTTFHVPYECS